MYARVSTEKQADKELSIPAQLQAMHEYARRQGWSVIQEFIESGASGRTTDRPALQAMLQRCLLEPRVDVLLVHKIDRLARSVHDHAAIRAQLRIRKIRLSSVVENVDDSVSGQLLENILASIGEFYSSNLGEETKKGMRMKVERGGWPFKPPRGYELKHDNDGKSRIVIGEEAPLIRFAHEQYASGAFSLHQLRYVLAESGLRTSAGKIIALSGVERILKNPFYAGRVRWHGVEHPGSHPAIVPEDLFRRVQAVLTTRHQDCGEKGRLHFLLRGLVRCRECGSKMTAERHGRWAYYRCVGRTLDPDSCAARMCSATVAETGLTRIYDCLRLPEPFKALVDSGIEAAVLERARGKDRRMRSMKVRKIRLEGREIRISEAFADGELSLKAYRSALTRVRLQLGATCRTLKDDAFDPQDVREKARELLQIAETLGQLHRRCDERQQQRLLRLVFKSMQMDASGITGFALQAPFDKLLRPEGKTPQGPIAVHFEDPPVRAAIESMFEVLEDPGKAGWLGVMLQH